MASFSSVVRQVHSLCSRSGDSLSHRISNISARPEEVDSRSALITMCERLTSDAAASGRSAAAMMREAKLACELGNVDEQRRLLHLAMARRQESQRLSHRATLIKKRMNDASSVVEEAETAKCLLELDLETKAAVDRVGTRFKEMDKYEDAVQDSVSDAVEMADSIADGGAGWSAAISNSDSAEYEPGMNSVDAMMQMQQAEIAHGLDMPLNAEHRKASGREGGGDWATRPRPAQSQDRYGPVAVSLSTSQTRLHALLDE